MMPAEPKNNTTPPRRAIPKRVRFEVLRRDDYTCRYCRATDQPLTLDHIVPDVLGGSDDPDNLLTACKDCNAGKSSSAPDAALVAQVSDETIRWGAAVRAAASKVLEDHEALVARLDPFCDYWYEFVPQYRLGNPRWELPSNWAGIIAGLLAAGLPDMLVTDSMRVALTTRGVDDRFRYFLGVARNRLTELHAEARRLIDSGEV